MAPAGLGEATPTDVDFGHKTAHAGVRQLDQGAAVGDRVFVVKAHAAARDVFTDHDRRFLFEQLAIAVERCQAEKDGNCDAIVVAPLAFDGRMKSRQERLDLDRERGAGFRGSVIFDCESHVFGELQLRRGARAVSAATG